MSPRVKKSGPVVHAILAVAAGATDALPVASAPPPPEGFVPTKLGRGGRPQKSQINLAPKAATELRTSTHYAGEFGNAAPDPVAVADALSTARAWSDKLQNANDWQAYVKEQEHLAWKHAVAVSDPLRSLFEVRAERDPNIGTTYPSLSAFFGVAKERAAKGAATKKRQRNAKTAPVAQTTPTATTASTGTKLLN